MELRPFIETLEGEHLKTAAEFALHSLAKWQHNAALFNMIRGGERIEDERLRVSVADLDFENPLMVGAGWDKRGWAVDGLYELGFAGTEVGSVLVHPQKGNPRPRLFYTNGVGLNRLGFNSKGEEVVGEYLDEQKRPGVTGISLGKNKLVPDSQAPWAHAAVADHLHKYADYFVINVASPNTPGLRKLLDTEPLTDIVQAVKEILGKRGNKPLFIKTTVDLDLENLDRVLNVCVDEGLGVIDTNTTVDEAVKGDYGWTDQMGGVSGANPKYRQKATERMKYITRQTRGTGVARIGVGAIHDTDTAIERLQAGAQAIQTVTGIRLRKGKIARDINMGILNRMEKDGVKNVEEYVGIAA
jgi:dihydroorotate dehydrogenase